MTLVKKYGMRKSTRKSKRKSYFIHIRTHTHAQTQNYILKMFKNLKAKSKHKIPHTKF